MNKTETNQQQYKPLVTIGIDQELLDELSERGKKEGVRHAATWLRLELYRLGYGKGLGTTSTTTKEGGRGKK